MALHYFRLPAYQGEPAELSIRRKTLAKELRRHSCEVKTLECETVEITIRNQTEKSLLAMAGVFEEQGFPVTFERPPSSDDSQNVRSQDRVAVDESELCGTHVLAEDGRFAHRPTPMMSIASEVY